MNHCGAISTAENLQSSALASRRSYSWSLEDWHCCVRNRLLHTLVLVSILCALLFLSCKRNKKSSQRGYFDNRDCVLNTFVREFRIAPGYSNVYFLATPVNTFRDCKLPTCVIILSLNIIIYLTASEYNFAFKHRDANVYPCCFF